MTLDELIADLNLSDAQIRKLRNNLQVIELSRLEGLAADVARAEEGSIMTRKGLDVLAKGCAGKQIKYTRVALGDSVRDGKLVELTNAQIVELEDLIHFREDLPLVDCKFLNNGTMVVQSMLQNADFDDGFWCREMGLFAEDPDSHEEVLYSYKNTGILSGYTPSGKGAVLMNLLLNLVTVVDNATNIVAVLDASLLYVNQAQLLEHINSATPHPNIPQLKDALDSAPIIWANDSDNQLHPLSIENLTAQVLSTEAEPLKQITNRLMQVENNVANLFMQLGSPDANLIVYDDLIACDSVDLLKVKVLNTAGGPSDVYVESLEGIRDGHFYNISDGSRSLYLRSKATACNDGLYNVMFEEQITKTFNLDKTYLYRSTASVGSGRAIGSTKELQKVFAPDDTFSGVQSSTTQTITLKTTQANASNFDLQGDASFNASGFFTIV